MEPGFVVCQSRISYIHDSAHLFAPARAFAFYTLFGYCIVPDLRGFQSRRRHADVQTRPIENARAHAHGRRDICGQRIVVRVILLDHADESFAAERINPLALRVVVDMSHDPPTGTLATSLPVSVSSTIRNGGLRVTTKRR